MNLSNQDVQLAQPMWTSSATAQHVLGTRGCDNFGRVYRYVKAGAVDLIAGSVIQSPAVIAGHQSLVVNTTGGLAVGATSVSVTCVSSVAAAFYNDGYAIIATSAGAGYMYTINNHAAVSTGAVGAFNFYAPEDVLQVAINATSTVTLVPNKYSNVVIVPPTTATGLVVGVATYIITAAQFGWIQTWGQCAVRCNDASAMGQLMNGISASTGNMAGLTSPAVTGNAVVGQILGQIYQTGVAGQWVCCDLRVSP